VVESGEQAAGRQVALDAAEQRAVAGRGCEARDVEPLLAAVGQADGAGLGVEEAHEEARLLHLDLAAEALHLHDVLALFRQVAHGAVEEGAQLRVREGLAFVGPVPVVVQHQTEGRQRRRPGRHAIGSGTAVPAGATRSTATRS